MSSGKLSGKPDEKLRGGGGERGNFVMEWEYSKLLHAMETRVSSDWMDHLA